MDKYNHKKIEAKWQQQWEKWQINKCEDGSKKTKRYILDMFPYPSGEGLHVGHPEGYIATDIYCRYLRYKGFNVLHPMGWDAFGLPAENYAIKTGAHPRETTKKNIVNFKRQIKSLGFSYDWSREVNTTDPEYFKWTQWIFLQLFKKGLAYEAIVPINWCPSCKTGLANEEVVKGKCERCHTEVVKKDMKQWMLKITDYADRLLSGLDKLDWPESIKSLQKNWIGRSEGASVRFQIKDYQLEVFTTRPDTLFGATYMVIAPEHELIEKFKGQILNLKEVIKYINKAKKKSDLERTDLSKEKTGVELKGVRAINPVNKEEIPIWVADYVLISYGTGAIMAVPAHDERDYEFAKKYNIKIVTVIEPVMGKPQDNEEFRRSIVALVRNPKNGKVLSLNWGKARGGNLFIGGGLKEGEDVIVCAQREIAEETGYNNVKFIAKTETIHHHYIAYSKGNVNRFIDAIGLYFELEGKDNGGQKLEKDEKDKFVVEWIDEQTVEQNVNDALHKHVFDRFVKNRPYTDDGIAINSGEFNGLTTNEFKDKITKWLEDKKVGQAAINYKLRDWVFSRQRYWGEPIPLIHCEKCGIVPVPEKDLPLELPKVKKYEPTGTGESPLANIKDWVNVKCPKCGGSGKRETNTMPQWAGSSWYWLRYIDPDNKKEFADKKKLKNWLPVDVYVGGAEHAVLHLLYARFWNMVLFDLGFVPIEEPFQKLINQGTILGPDNEKMSKSRGNVVSPDDILNKYGADTLRMYEMFMGPLEDTKPWDTKGIIGIRRFLDRVWFLFSFELENLTEPDKSKENENILKILINKTVKKVGEDIENFRFNTAISSMMIFINKSKGLHVYEYGKETKIFEKFLIILSPFAPHLAEELWLKLGNKESIFKKKWPEYDKKLVKDEKFELVIQINGKVRDKMMVKIGISQPEVEKLIKQSGIINKRLDGKEIKKIIYIPNKLINIVV